MIFLFAYKLSYIIVLPFTYKLPNAVASFKKFILLRNVENPDTSKLLCMYVLPVVFGVVKYI